MSDYRESEIREHYHLEIERGCCVCILSGLHIYNKKLFSLEHYIPTSVGTREETHVIENIFPAYKIINNIKASRLPCVWEENKVRLLQKSLKKNKLSHDDQRIVENAIEIAPFYHIDPCTLCIWKKKCENER